MSMIQNLTQQVVKAERKLVQRTGAEVAEQLVKPLAGLGKDTLALEARKVAAHGSEIAKAVSSHVQMPMRAGNHLELFVDGKQAFPELHKAIDGAKKRLDLEFFAFHEDPTGFAVADKLIAKANSGVEVNLLVDFLNFRKSKNLMQKMEAGGVRVRPFTNGYKIPALHVNSITDHRKVLLADGKLALSGGMNIGEPYEKHWHDLMFKVEGPTVQDYYSYFHKNWALSDGPALKEITLDTAVKGTHAAQVAVTAPKAEEIRQSTIAAYGAAKKKILAQSPYFIDDEVIASLKSAAKRGVDVTVITPKVGDNPFVDNINANVRRDLYQSGVRVRQYDTMNYDIGKHDHATDRFNHGKVSVVDDKFVMIGTANADNRSMVSSREINLHVDSPDFAKEVTDRVFNQDFSTLAKSYGEPGGTGSWWAKKFKFVSDLRELF